MIANSQETFFVEMDKHVCSYTMYFPTVFDSGFELEIFKNAVEYFLDKVPHLKRRCVNHFWRASWTAIPQFTVESLFDSLEIVGDKNESEKDFFSRAIECFYQMKNKAIDLEKEAPVKFKVISLKDKSRTMIVFCVHHSVADGRGSMQIMSTIGEVYTAMSLNTELPDIKNYRKIPCRYLKESFFTILKRTFLTKENPLATENTTDLIDCSKDVSQEENFISLEVGKEKIRQLKAVFEEWNYSTNDIFVYMLLSICSDLVGENVNDNTVYNVGIAVDNRKDIKKNILSITNYASMCPFYIRQGSLKDRAKVKEELQYFKKTATGLSFSKEFILLNMFPMAIQKKVFEGNVKEMIKEMSCKGIQTTNVGEMTKFVNNYNNTLKDSAFIGPAGKYGMPIMSMSLFEGDMRIYFRRTNDSGDFCSRLKRLLQERIDNVTV